MPIWLIQTEKDNQKDKILLVVKKSRLYSLTHLLPMPALKWLIVLSFAGMFSCRKEVKDVHPEYYGDLLHRIEKADSVAELKNYADLLELAIQQYPYGLVDKCNFWFIKTGILFRNGEYKHG